MTKKELVKKLEEVCGELDVFSDNHTLFQAVKALTQIQYKLENIVQEVEDGDIENSNGDEGTR